MKKSVVLALAMALGVAGSAFAAEINDKLEVNGEVRLSRLGQKAEVNDGHKYEAHLRTRLEAVVKPVENLKVVLMAENKHAFKEGDRKNKGAFHHDVNLRRAYLEGKIGKADFTIGRVGVGIADGYVLDDDLDRCDSILIGHDINDKVKIEGFAAINVDGREDEFKNKRKKMYGARVTYKPVDNFEAIAEYAHFSNYAGEDENGEESNLKNKIIAVTANYSITPDLVATAVLLAGDASGDEALKETSRHGIVWGLAYKGAEPEEKGTWGVNLKYYNQGKQTYMAHAIDGNTDFDGGFKGWSIGADYTIVKNLVAEVTYYDTKDKGDSGDKDKRLWTALTWSF